MSLGSLVVARNKRVAEIVCCLHSAQSTRTSRSECKRRHDRPTELSWDVAPRRHQLHPRGGHRHCLHRRVPPEYRLAEQPAPQTRILGN
ncbi:uncharacterized protein M421DRAFT_264396 [Didymella exigua CBS 183.55]|uniref:Uncharacterized protein n=1 Tax=Didymella exigua CBS 183.55 TaxID=1150837 RepID=A0A6A5REW7_9PLEO|nr:uncharacterized protein M421DRAFT_264396 [Didymella exigua CBS 183.55]KAF1925066.1 hypothetical protein M421DRAFT_264396 [Didymella exigua CBS 183.55]